MASYPYGASWTCDVAIFLAGKFLAVSLYGNEAFLRMSLFLRDSRHIDDRKGRRDGSSGFNEWMSGWPRRNEGNRRGPPPGTRPIPTFHLPRFAPSQNRAKAYSLADPAKSKALASSSRTRCMPRCNDWNDTCPGCFNGNNALGQAFQPDIPNRQAGKPDLRKHRQAGKPDLREINRRLENLALRQTVRLESLTYATPR